MPIPEVARVNAHVPVSQPEAAQPSLAERDAARTLARANNRMVRLQRDAATPLWNMTNQGDAAKVASLLKDSRIDPNASPPGCHGLRPLHQAVRNGDLAMVKVLMSAPRLYADAPDNQGVTPLYDAAERGNAEIAAALLEKADPNYTNGPHGTALHAAALYGHVQIVDLLLDRGDADAIDANGATALHVAIGTGNADMVRALLRRADPDIADGNGLPALHLCVGRGQLDLLPDLLCKADPNATDRHGNTALHLAASIGNAAMVAVLLQRCDCTIGGIGGYTALFMAARCGNLDVMNILLERTDPNQISSGGFTPLHIAAYRGHVDIVNALIGRSDVHARTGNGATALHLAATRGHTGVVDALLAVVDPDIRDAQGLTPLYLAASRGNLDVVNALLEQADPDIAAPDGSTALHAATDQGHIQTVQALLTKADPDACKHDGITALHLAASQDQLRLVRLLLESANPDARTSSGATPLHCAAQSGNRQVVEALLQKADPNAAMTDGALPLDIAIGYGRGEIVDALLDKADPNVLVPALMGPGAMALVSLLRTPSGLDALSDSDAKLRVLEHWAQYRADRPSHVILNKHLTATTNFRLGRLLAAREVQFPTPAGACDKNAVFRFTLALEQLLDAGDQRNRAPAFAEALLEIAPLSQTHFNLAGVAVPRREIHDLAHAKGEIALASALGQTMGQVRAGWGANVHFYGFLLLGQNLLQEIKRRNDDPAHAASAAGSAASVPGRVLPEPAPADMSEAVRLCPYPEYTPVLENREHAPALLAFLQHDTTDGLAPLARQIHHALQALDVAVLRSLSMPPLHADEIANRLDIDEVTRTLVNIRTELRVVPAIRDAIVREAPALQAGEIDTAIRAHLANAPDRSLATLARDGLTHILSVNRRIREDGLDTDTHSVVDAIWRYIDRQTDGDLRQQLVAMLILQLADIGLDPVCNTGCVQRLLMGTGTIDATLRSREPDAEVIRHQLHLTALDVTSTFDDEHAIDYGAGPEVVDEVIKLKQQLVKASAIDELVRRRGWNKDKVAALLQPILEQIKDL